MKSLKGLNKSDKILLAKAMATKAKIRAKTNYVDYLKYTIDDFVLLPHTKLIADTIDRAIENRKDMLKGVMDISNQYLMFNLPPRHGKSMTITETLPSYFMGVFPKSKVIMTAYSITLADDFARFNAKKLDTTPVFGCKVENNNQDRMLLSNGSVCVKAGIMGGITGKGAHLLIVDDPIKTSEEARSQTIRDKIWREWESSLSTRLEQAAIVIVIMTRWHEDDLSGRLLNPEYGNPLPWQVINLPLAAEEGDALGRTIGEPLWDRYGYDFIEERKQYPQTYNALYQGRPTSEEGNLIRREWFENQFNWFNRTDDIIKSMDSLSLSVDATFKDTAKSDKVAIHVWGKKGIDYYLIDVNTGRYDFLTTLHAIKSMHAKYNIGFTFIEDKANGSAIINTLRREMSGIIAVNPLGGKESRVQSILPYLAGNNVKVPREPFTSEVLEEWYSFPTGAHDDNVDAMTQAISQIVYYSKTKELDERDTKKNNDFNGFVNAMTDWG